MKSLRGVRHGRWLGGVLLLLALSGCRNFDVEPPDECVEDSSCDPSTNDGGSDGGNTGTDGGEGDGGNTGTDGGNTGTDGGNTGADAGTDAGVPGADAGTDAGLPVPDAGADAGMPVPDAGSDAGLPVPDAGTDAGMPAPDAGTDAGMPFPDAGSDAGMPVPDAGTDAGMPVPDAGTDAGLPDSDAGFDAGLPGLDAGFDDAGLPEPEPDLDGGVTPDGGIIHSDAGTIEVDGGIIVDELPVGECRDDLCLEHKYVLSPAHDGFNGLWLFDPYDVYLAHTEGAQVVQFNDGFAPTAAMNVRPFQLHGTTPDNLWAIAPPEASDSRPCAPSSPAAGTPCASPVARFDGQHWASIPAPSTGPSILPPALFTGPGATWVAGSHGGALRWDGTTWHSEPASSLPPGTLRAFWSNTSEPLLGVGATQGPVEFGAYWQRLADGTWTGPTLIQSAPMPPPALSAIAGPSTDHLYAVGGQVVLRRTPFTWVHEPLPQWLPSGCQLSEAQDVWVNEDGSDVWVTMNSACVLRKKQGTWFARRLPVPADFQARQVEGSFDGNGQTVDLWITGYQPTGPHAGAVAYHFKLSWP